MNFRWTESRWAGRLCSVLLPPAFCAAWVPFRSSAQNTDAALVVVILIVAIAISGDRVAGILAAVSSGAWFDFFLTRPYETFSINSRSDVETGVLLLVVGAAVTEIARWGRRHHARAAQIAGYLAGLHDAAQTAASGTLPPSVLIDQVCSQLIAVLGLRGCRFNYGTGLGNPRLRRDGRVTRGADIVDVDGRGLPTDLETEILVEGGGSYRGRFLLTAPPKCRPTLEQRSVAVALADQVGAALTEYSVRLTDH